MIGEPQRTWLRHLLVRNLSANASAELPDTSWSEERLVESIQKSASEDATLEQDRFVLLLALDELERRGTFENPGKVSDALLVSAQYWGKTSPAGGKIANLLARICNENHSAFEDALGILGKTDDLSPAMASCLSVMIPLTRRELQGRAIDSLVAAVMESSWAEDSDVGRDLFESLVKIGQNSLSKEVIQTVRPFLSDPRDFANFRRAVKIWCLVGGSELMEVLKGILEKSLEGYYPDNSLDELIMRYLLAHPDEGSVPLLVRVIRHDKRNDLLEGLKRFNYEITAEMLVGLIEESLRNWNYDLLHTASRVLADLNPSIAHVKRLLSIDMAVQQSEPRYYLVEMVSKRGEEFRDLLFDYYKGSDDARASLAKECFRKMGVTIDEISSRVGSSPVVSLWEYFFPDDSIAKIWKGRPASLRENTKGQGVNRFDFLVLQTFCSLGFVTMYVDKSRKEGVDVVAVAPTGSQVIIAGVTSGVPRDDLVKMDRIANEIRNQEWLGKERFAVIPVLFTDLASFTSDHQTLAQQNRIVLLSASDVEEVVSMARTGKSHKNLIQFLAEKKPITLAL